VTTADNYPMILCSVWVPGSPKTKGSLTVVNSGSRGRKAHVEDTPESKRWRMLIVERIRAWRIRLGAHFEPYPGSVNVTCTFYQAIKPEDLVRKVAGSGDLDKLVRNVFDALSVNDDPRFGAGVILDDMQVTDLTAGKRPAAWSGTGEPGLWLQVERVQP
jgi:Holliday junction resolvase RusA-like endonuclease